tara:strand:+ start:32099 stop:32713 length:615 start_codon:yes stop_codon:yes gene_type:complete
MPKAVDEDKRRHEFFTASWDIIATEGLSAATMRRVSSGAGCTTGALTHYFPDRASLLIETLRAAHFATAARMRDAASVADTPLGRLRSVLLEALPLDTERMREWKVWLAFWAAAIGNPVLIDENAKRYAEWRAVIEILVAPLLSQKRDALVQANLVVALVDGIALHAVLSDMGEARLDQIATDCTEQLDKYLGAVFPSVTNNKE